MTAAEILAERARLYARIKHELGIDLEAEPKFVVPLVARVAEKLIGKMQVLETRIADLEAEIDGRE